MNVAQKTDLITGTNRGIGEALVNEALRRPCWAWMGEVLQ
jgi:NAD(P)-dependent dehydrogenase (short-subunit alcohol dehydrogenase family)